MTDDELERYLGRFRVAEPPEALKAAVLRTARRRRQYSDARIGWAIAAAVTVVFAIHGRAESESRERRLEAAMGLASAADRVWAEMLGPEVARHLALSRLLEEPVRHDIRDGSGLDVLDPNAAERLPW